MCGRQWRRILNSIDITIKYTGALEDIGVILQKYTSAIQNRQHGRKYRCEPSKTKCT